MNLPPPPLRPSGVCIPLKIRPTQSVWGELCHCVGRVHTLTPSRSHSPDSEDEMCNFYIMYYMDNNGRSLVDDDCWETPPRSLVYPDTLPPLPKLVGHMEHHHHGMGGDEEEEEDHDDGTVCRYTIGTLGLYSILSLVCRSRRL